MADGGVLLADSGTKETTEQLLSRMKAKYGLGDAEQPVAQTAPAPAPDQPQSQTVGKESAASTSRGMFGQVIDSTKRRNEEMNRVSRYARGGIMTVVGAGSGTSDSVPVIVAGQKVRLSNGEGAAILPAKTMKNKAAVHAIEEIIEETNGKPTATRDENDYGMACGGVKARKMAGGGVLDPQDDENPNSRKIPGVPRLFSALPDGGYLSSTDGRQAIAKGISGEGIRPDMGILGPKGAADSSNSASIASAAQSSYGNEGRPSAISAVNGLESSPLASNTGNAGDARYDAQSGILSFTNKGFDPTRQSFAPGTGAITDPKTGRTMLLTGSEQGMASGSQSSGTVANPGSGTDAYGNSTARTDQMKAELAQLQANGRTSEGPSVSMLQSLPSEQANRDRFDRFVRQSTADRLTRDLAMGGGTAQSNAGKIEALNAIQRGIKSENDANSAQNIAAMRARSGIDETRMSGDNRLAGIALQGQNNLALEKVRQGFPSTALLARKMQVEIDDADAVRAVRKEIADSAASGNQTAYSTAVKKGIAFGILKNERPPNEFAFAPSALGGGHVIDKATGHMMHIDADGKATPVQMSQQAASLTKEEVTAAIKAGASKDAIKARIIQLGKNPVDYGL
jgi:hypothetical protein